MYSIYADQTCIYTDNSPSNKNKITNPKLVLEENAAGSLQFTIPYANAGYDDIKRLLTEVIVKRDGVEIWSGRVLDEDVDFYNNKTFYCEGELAYFNDSNQPPAEYHDITPRAMLETFVNIHNSQVSNKYTFTVGIVTVTDPNDSLYRYTNYETTLSAIGDKLINRLGGHLRIRKANGVRYLDYLKDYPNVSTQQINFGKNLLDFAKNYSMADFVTVIIPRGEMISPNEYTTDNDYAVGDYIYKDGYIYRCLTAVGRGEAWSDSKWKQVQKYIAAITPYLTVEEVNNRSIYVYNQETVNQYGWIAKTVDWSDVTEASSLLTKAREYLTKVNYDNLELSVNAIDLRALGTNYEAINLLDEVRVISKPHNLNALFPVRKLEITLDRPEDTRFTLTLKDNLKTSLTSSTSSSLSNLEDEFKNIANSTSTILDSARKNATGLINTATNGFVTILKGANGTSELIISNERDWTQATKLWRWNINGLGYSNNGGRTYGLAMTMDGAIVADFITAGTMSADRIRGGTLEIGGSSLAKDGVLQIKDSSNRVLIEISKYGMTLYDESGNGKVWLDHSGLSMTGGTINASTVNASTINGSRIYGVTIESSCVIQTDNFRVDSAGSIYGHGDCYFEDEGSFKRCIGRLGVQGQDLYIWGDKSRVVETENYGPRQFTAYETPTGYFGDIGEGKTDENGICVITIDDIFREATDDFCNYQVFLQAYEGGRGLQVIERKPDHFTVYGDINTSFGWEIKAPQKDLSGKRYAVPPYEVIEAYEEGDTK